MRLKAVQYYFQLLRKGHMKLKASQIVAELLNCGICEELLPSVGIENKTTISKKTATRWLKKMGFIFSQYTKGIYINGYEKENIVINTELKNGEHLHILVTHDEMTFQSNDGQKSDTIRRLKLSEDDVDDRIPHEARVIINPGKNFDGWWNIDQLIDQVYIKKQSSQNKSDDTHNVANMNLNPSGKQPVMHNIIFNGQVQSMVFPVDYPDEKLQVSLENSRCYAHHVLTAQEDFLNQKPILQEEAAKRYAQQHCNYTWKDLQKTVP
ncbi:hypothetical protein C1646_768870 [Rhizophagus diaphanus]|nr:hypothetical protein C1646_768870 [Rhizophagus diaphanus] [Rhizophagus sp. MUCL 43196]